MKIALMAFLSATVLGAPSSMADSFWSHNGSEMRMRVEGDKRIMVYEAPRQGMIQQGVKPGTVLFEITRKGRGVYPYAGSAYAFSARCGQRSFEVQGELRTDGNEIFLVGKVPTLGAGSCRPTGLREEELLFKLVRSEQAAPVLRSIRDGTLCQETGFKQYRACLEKEANALCSGRPTYEDLVWCWRKAVVLVYRNSGLTGEAKNLALGDTAPFTTCERGACKFAGGGTTYSCKRTDAQTVSECDGDRCTPIPCPIRECKMLCASGE